MWSSRWTRSSSKRFDEPSSRRERYLCLRLRLLLSTTARSATAARWLASACPTRPISSGQKQPSLATKTNRLSGSRCAACTLRATSASRCTCRNTGAYVGLDGEELVIKRRDGSKVRARIPNTSQLVLFGNVQISTQALRKMFEREIPVSFHSSGGYFVGRTQTHESKNVELRLMQYRASIDPRVSLELGRAFVEGKIRNCRTLLRRNPDGS